MLDTLLGILVTQLTALALVNDQPLFLNKYGDRMEWKIEAYAKLRGN